MKYVLMIALLMACGTDDKKSESFNGDKAEETARKIDTEVETVVFDNLITDGVYTIKGAWFIYDGVRYDYALEGTVTKTWKTVGHRKYEVTMNGYIEFFGDGELVSVLGCDNRVQLITLDSDGWISDSVAMGVDTCISNLRLTQVVALGTMMVPYANGYLEGTVTTVDGEPVDYFVAYEL